MEKHCSNCAAAIEAPWKFCPHCGTVSLPEAPRKAEPEEPEPAPVQGAFGGLLFGMLAVPLLVIVGTMLCLTGLGAVLGIPMIVAAVFAPLLGPMIGMGAVKGKCPWCGVPVSSVSRASSFACHACNQRIAVRHRVLARAE